MFINYVEKGEGATKQDGDGGESSFTPTTKKEKEKREVERGSHAKKGGGGVVEVV